MTKENPEDLFPIEDEKRILLFKKVCIGFSAFMIAWNLVLFIQSVYTLATSPNALERFGSIVGIFFNILDTIIFSLCIVGMFKNNIRFLAHPINYAYWGVVWQLFKSIIFLIAGSAFNTTAGVICLLLIPFYFAFYYSLLVVYKNLEVSTRFVEWVDDYAKQHGKRVVVMDA